MFRTDHSTRSVSSPPRQCAPTSLISCAENKPDFYFQRPGSKRSRIPPLTTQLGGILSLVYCCLLAWDLKISLWKPDVPPAPLSCRRARLTDGLLAFLTALWFSQFREDEKMLLCLGRPLLCLREWLCACMQLAQVLMPYELFGRVRVCFHSAAGTQTGTADVTKKTHERNESTVFTFWRFRPLWQGRSPSLTCPYLPSNTLSFFQSFLPLFDITCSSRLLHLCVPPLSLSATANLSTVVLSCNPLPSFSPVVYFPLYLYNYLSALSSRRTPCHPSICLYVKISPSAFTFILHFSFPALPYLTGLTPSSLSSFPPSFYLSSSHQLPPPACRHLSIPPPGHGLIEI